MRKTKLDAMISKSIKDAPGRSPRKNRAYYHDERARHINRKKNIIRRVSPDSDHPYWIYKYEGEL